MAHELAVAQHGDLVGQPHDVAQDVRDVDDRCPSWCSRSIRAKRRSVSRAVSDVVGSSKIIRRASKLSALAISANCRSPGESFSTRVSGETSRSTMARNCLVWLRMALRLSMGSHAEGREAVDKDVFGDAQVGEEVEFLVDEGHAGVVGVARVRAAHRAGRPAASARCQAPPRRRPGSSACSCRRRSRLPAPSPCRAAGRG